MSTDLCVPPGAKGRSGPDDRPRSGASASGAAAGGGVSGAFRGGRSSADTLRGGGAGQGPKTRGIRRPVQVAVASVCYEEAPRKHLAPGGATPQGIGPIGDRNYETQAEGAGRPGRGA